MPMNKSNLLFWMTCIYSLQINTLYSSTYKMYEIDLQSTLPENYDFYIKNYYSSNDNILIITEVKSPQFNIYGFLCIHSNRTSNTYTKKLYCFSKDFTNINKIFYKFDFTMALRRKNILNIQIPSMLFNNAIKLRYGVEITKITENVSDIGLKMQNDFIEFVFLNKLKTILSCRQLLEELTNRPVSRIMHSLENEDYILAFFDRDYCKIISFLKKLILLLQEDNELLKSKLSIFLTNFMKNNLNKFWEDEFMLFNKDFDIFKNYNLSNCFFTDLINLFCLIENPNHKFKLYDYDRYIGSLFGYSYVAVLIYFQEDIDEKNLKCFAYDKKNNELKYKLLIDSKKRLVFFMFELHYLKESNITQIDCLVQTPNKHYESCNIDLIEYF